MLIDVELKWLRGHVAALDQPPADLARTLAILDEVDLSLGSSARPDGRAGGMRLRQIERREAEGKNVRLHLECGHSKLISHRVPALDRAYCPDCPPLTSGQAPR